MDLNQLLREQHDNIVKDAFQLMERCQLKNYQKVGDEHSRQRLKALFTLTVRAVKERNLGPMIAHAETIAQERYASGFDLWEVQTAFNVLEEAIWVRIIKELPPAEYAEALGLVSTILGAGKDKLAREYVSLASKMKTQTLNLQSLFTGIAGS